MKKIVLACALFFSLICDVIARPENHDSSNLWGNVSLLSNWCGYAFDEEILSQISKSTSKINDRIILLDFYVVLRNADRPIYGKLSFGCFMVESTAPKQGTTHRLTAAEEIAQEDSGGRYARNIVWQRRYLGVGWSGTIAYVNSIFGDQERSDIPDYFMICPDKGELACFSFEIEKTRLREKESDRIPELLHGINIANSRKEISEISDKQ
jgi:hypothetical protein